MSALRYALELDCVLPGDLPAPAEYPMTTETLHDWYAVVAVTEDTAFIEDVRRSEWPLPEGVIDARPDA